MEGKEPFTNEKTSSQEALQEKYLESLEQIEEGGTINGVVVAVTEDQVFVDVGYKSEGKISLDEFEKKPEVGETVKVVLLNRENKYGQVVVSKRKADEKVFWKELKTAQQDKTPVKGKVVKTVKGGFEVSLGYGIKAFAPISKIDVRRVETPEEYIGLEADFLVERLFSENRVNIVVSRRNFLEQQTKENREKFFADVKEGDSVDGTVKSFTSFGAFIDLGGFDGLLHINDMSWGHVTRPKDYVKKGDKITVKVIKIDPETQKINLSLKDFSDNPWNTFHERYNVDDVVAGKVTKLTDFGAFVEIEEGIEGLVHVSELSWVKKVRHPKEVVSIGDEVEVKILGYDIDEGKVSLGMKQVLPNPWESIAEKYPEGTRMKGVVKKITNAGAFVEVEEGIDGFLHVDNLSWTKKIKNPGSVLKEGEEIEYVIISVEPEDRNIRIGVKQLENDPWADLKKAHPVGSTIEGEVTSIADFGVFVKVTGDIEGLIPKSNICDPHQKTQDEAIAEIKEGDKITAAVMEISPGKQRLSLSVRELFKKEQRKEMEKYIHDDEDDSTFTMADLMSKE